MTGASTAVRTRTPLRYEHLGMSTSAPSIIHDARAQCSRDVAAIAPDAGPSLWDAECQFLIRCWTEPHRSYHCLRHVADMMAALDQLAKVESGLSEKSLLIARVATWFHDAAYDPRATPGSNEQRSATLARDHLHRVGAADNDVDAVEALILMTIKHAPIAASTRPVVEPLLLDAFHDADLWILSAPPLRYRDYARGVRDEYAHVPYALFASGRSHILRGFLRRSALYRTEYAQENWHHRAASNIERELAELT